MIHGKNATETIVVTTMRQTFFLRVFGLFRFDTNCGPVLASLEADRKAIFIIRVSLAGLDDWHDILCHSA